MQLSDFISVFLCNGWWQTQELVTGQSAENKIQWSAQPQMGHAYNTPSPKFRDHSWKRQAERLQESEVRDN